MAWFSSLTLLVIVFGSTANGNHQPNSNSAFAALLNDAQASTGAHALSQTNMCIQCGLRSSLSMFSIQVVSLTTGMCACTICCMYAIVRALNSRRHIDTTPHPFFVDAHTHSNPQTNTSHNRLAERVALDSCDPLRGFGHSPRPSLPVSDA